MRIAPRDQRAVELLEELVVTTQHMNAKKRSLFVLQLEEELGTGSWAAKHARWGKDAQNWREMVLTLYAAKRADRVRRYHSIQTRRLKWQSTGNT